MRPASIVFSTASAEVSVSPPGTVSGERASSASSVARVIWPKGTSNACGPKVRGSERRSPSSATVSASLTSSTAAAPASVAAFSFVRMKLYRLVCSPANGLFGSARRGSRRRTTAILPFTSSPAKSSYRTRGAVMP